MKACVQTARMSMLACRTDCRTKSAAMDLGACMRGCSDRFRSGKDMCRSGLTSCVGSCNAPLSSTPASSCVGGCGQSLGTCSGRRDADQGMPPRLPHRRRTAGLPAGLRQRRAAGSRDVRERLRGVHDRMRCAVLHHDYQVAAGPVVRGVRTRLRGRVSGLAADVYGGLPNALRVCGW